jgi:hypothetical protein
MKNRPYFSRRSGAQPSRLSFAQVGRLVASIFQSLEIEGYFQEVFGYYCVDGGAVRGSAGPNVEAFVYRKTLLEGVVPIREKLATCDEATLFTLVEFLCDCASKPLKGTHHAFSDCGWHYHTFDKEGGLERWRDEINAVLPHYGDGFELSERGEVERIGPTGLRELTTAPIPKIAGDRNREKIEAAIHRFRHGRATRKQRQDAVRDLADVLEFYRPKVRRHLLKKDESDLFNIANNYAIRHHTDGQKSDYDPAWLAWMFYLYLSTIHLVLRLIEREESARK